MNSWATQLSEGHCDRGQSRGPVNEGSHSLGKVNDGILRSNVGIRSRRFFSLKADCHVSSSGGRSFSWSGHDVVRIN